MVLHSHKFLLSLDIQSWETGGRLLLNSAVCYNRFALKVICEKACFCVDSETSNSTTGRISDGVAAT